MIDEYNSKEKDRESVGQDLVEIDDTPASEPVRNSVGVGEADRSVTASSPGYSPASEVNEVKGGSEPVVDGLVEVSSPVVEEPSAVSEPVDPGMGSASSPKVETVEEKKSEPKTVDEPTYVAESPAPVVETTSPTGVETTAKEPEVVKMVPVTPVSGSSSILAALKGMLSFFTLIRLDVGQKEFDAMETNFWLAPAIGLLNGLVAFLICSILGWLDCGLIVCSVAAVASMYLFSKFLHFDGLTDFGDGMIVSSGRREDHIRALKDSLIGAGGFGVTLTVVLLTMAFYYQLGVNLLLFKPAQVSTVALIAIGLEILIKNSMVAAAAFGEPSNGMAARQVRCTTTSSLVKSTILTVVLLVIVSILMCGLVDFQSRYGINMEIANRIVLLVVAVLTSIATGFVMAKVANKTFGYVNGDILGATNEISRCVILLVTLVMMGLMF